MSISKPTTKSKRSAQPLPSASDTSSLTPSRSLFSSRSASGAALLCLGLALLFRLFYAAHLGLAEDEAYYWQWSRHLALSYYDQGAGIAWVIALGTRFLGDTTLGIRIVPILMTAATGWFGFLTARRWFGGRVALWAVLLMTVSPLLAAGGTLATYDVPQVFCWAAALYILTWTLQEKKTFGWYLVGILVGLGGLCKLTMLLFAPCVLIFLLITPVYRRWLQTPHPYLGFVIALLLFAPVFLWNAQHGWMGLLHWAMLGDRTRNAEPLRWFGDFWGGQAIALSPFLLIAELWALTMFTRSLIKMKRNSPALSADEKGFDNIPRAEFNPPADSARFALAFAVPILVLCSIIALRSKMEINWPVPTHLAGLMATAFLFDTLWQRKKRAAVVISIGVSMVLIAFAFFPDLFPVLGIRLTALQAQKLNQTYGWESIASGVQAARDRLAQEKKPYFVFGVNYRVNSEMAFYLKDHPQTQSLYLNSRRDQYWIWTNPKELIGQNAVFCLDDVNDDAVRLAKGYFASVEEPTILSVYRPGFSGPVKRWYIFLCHDFKGYDPLRHVSGW